MARGVELTFDLMVTAIVVGVVLAILMLIFVDHARSFNESVQENRCSGFDCGFDFEESRKGLVIAHPSTVYTGERAVFRVIDNENRFSTMRVEVDAPSTVGESPLSGRAIDPGPSVRSPHVHTPFFEGTDEAGSYQYRLIGVRPDGEEVVIERGELRILERSGVTRASVRIEAPQRIPSPARLTVRIPTSEYGSGRLVFVSADRAVRIDVEPAGEGILAGRSYEGLLPGIYVLDPDASRLDDQPLDASITLIVRVSDPTPCDSSASCSEEMPFCTRGVCSPVCAAAGESAADDAGCCADLSIENGVCTLPGRPLRIVLVPIGASAQRMGVLASELESALRSSSPLNTCPSSRLSIDIAQSCSGCPLADRAVTEDEYAACLDRMLSCALVLRPDADLVGGVVAAPSMRISSEQYAFFARSERGGQRFVIADPSSNAGGEFLRQIGFVYGLDQLACGAAGPACAGPNAADCAVGCTDADPSCFADPTFSASFVMASCDRLTFGPAGYGVLASMDAFVRATEVCR